MHSSKSIGLLALILLSLTGPAIRAEVRLLEIHRREPFAGGISFGETGPYEIIAGVAHFQVDPSHRATPFKGGLP